MFGVHKPEIGEFSQSIEELLVGFGIIDGQDEPAQSCPEYTSRRKVNSGVPGLS